MITFVLIHSPIVGPLTWTKVADELRSRGVEGIVPELPYDLHAEGPFWKLHAGAVAHSINSISEGRSLILVGHSGAGMLLPAIREISDWPVAGYIFVDASIPEDGKSRLDLLRMELPEAAEAVYQALAIGELLPRWTEEELREELPDAEDRLRLLAGLRPHPLAFQTEPIPVFASWPDAPCGYLRFVPNPAYDLAGERAKREGWAYEELKGGHFHAVVDPTGVAEALIRLARV